MTHNSLSTIKRLWRLKLQLFST